MIKDTKASLLTSIIFLVFIANLNATTPILPLSKIKPGMKGIGKTVFEGSKIEEFEIEVIDILKNINPQSDAILVRLYGDRLEKSGVISGMSGSPIYIDDKLVGALAFSLGIFMKDPIAGVTPIENMLEIEKKEKIRDQEMSSLNNYDEHLFSTCLFPDSNIKFDLLDYYKQKVTHWNHTHSQLQPIPISLTFSGFHANALKQFIPTLEQTGFQVSIGGTVSQNQGKQRIASLKPGDAVSGVIISGDLEVTSTGTITFIDNNKILAFGHPFFNSGPINIPMASAKIITTLSNLMHSQKLAATGDIIGSLIQDRPSGVLGIIGEQAPMLPVVITYISPFGETKTYQYKIAKDRSLNLMIPSLFYVTILSTLESARFSNGDYSLNLKGRYVVKDYPDVVLDNFYTTSNYTDPPGAGQDIMASAYDIVMTMIPLLINTYSYPDIEKVELTFQAITGKKSMKIEDIWYDKTEIVPGDNLNLIIRLREYHGNTVTVTKQVKIPENISSPFVFITIGSADYIFKWEKNVAAGKFQPQNMSELIQILNNRRKNNALYIQLKLPEKGAFIGGKELVNLPPTIMNIFSEKKVSGSFINLNERILSEHEIPMEYGIYGGKLIRLKVNKHKTF